MLLSRASLPAPCFQVAPAGELLILSVLEGGAGHPPPPVIIHLSKLSMYHTKSELSCQL